MTPTTQVISGAQKGRAPTKDDGWGSKDSGDLVRYPRGREGGIPPRLVLKVSTASKKASVCSLAAELSTLFPHRCGQLAPKQGSYYVMNAVLHTPSATSTPRQPRRTRKRVIFMMTLAMVPLIAEAEAREVLERTG